MNPTSELITYSTDTLKEMDQKDLLIQLICREDLNRPDRSVSLDAAKLKDESIAAARSFEAEIAKCNIPDLSAALAQIISVYERGGQ